MFCFYELHVHQICDLFFYHYDVPSGYGIAAVNRGDLGMHIQGVQK